MPRSRPNQAMLTTTTMLLLVILAACTLKPKPMDISKLNAFATRYTAAWCSHNAASVASFYDEKGFLKINEANPSVGRAAITEAAQGFMTAFPDIVVEMDSLDVGGSRRATYHWTLTGTNTGPGVLAKPFESAGMKNGELATTA